METAAQRIGLCLIATVAIALTLPFTTAAQSASLWRSVISAGGGVGVPSADGTHTMSITVGQPVIGVEKDNQAIAFKGFWYPRMTGTNPITGVTESEGDQAGTAALQVWRRGEATEFSTTSTASTDAAVIIYTLLGERILRLPLLSTSSGEHRAVWHHQGYAPAVYLAVGVGIDRGTSVAQTCILR